MTWKMCNKSSSKVFVAYGYADGDYWVRKGWRNIESGNCTTLAKGLRNKNVYYYADTSDDSGTWGGDTKLCLDPTEKFEYRKRKGSKFTCPTGGKVYGFKAKALGSGTTTHNLVD